ncbi:ABC transporter permease [Streptomyces sp. TLI_053]|uniref:ABC transporter permease n=1 Tax=Streptomyces sp. TLI_053 TaxID=1855352 RepID=UPI000B87A27F|nr:ABC transporter permease [Streptomyces sp. TLI_053]
MIRYILRTAALYTILVLAAATVTYFLAALSLDPRSNYLQRNPRPSDAVITATLNAYNLNPDVPVVERFLHWAGDVAHGDLGRTVTGSKVNTEFARRVAVSTRLLLVATILGTACGVLVGTWSAVRQYKLVDRVTAIMSFTILAVPVFVLATTAQLWARGVNDLLGTTLIEYTGEYSPQAHGTLERLVSRAQHLILPSLVLIAFETALFSRYQRSAMLDVLSSEFLRTARAKGLARRTALLKHGLRVALLPLIPLLVYNTVLLFTGAAFIEKAFGWRGMGDWLIDAITTNDVNAVASIGLFTAALVLIAALLCEVAHVALDPRIAVR